MTGARSGRTLKICIWTMQELSPLDGKNGYAVYDSASGAREGSLLWEPEKEADDMFKIQLKDLDNDGIKEIGISMTDG